jgi:hypothetical protein
MGGGAGTPLDMPSGNDCVWYLSATMAKRMPPHEGFDFFQRADSLCLGLQLPISRD